MAGNSERRGAKRTGQKKGQTVGSGGQRRKQLKGKGPTPKASDRPAHPAHRKARSAAKRAASPAKRTGGSRPAGGNRSRDTADGPEWVAGRNPVVEALRAHVPATALYVAERIDSDDRVRESMKLAGQLGIPLMEASRIELDKVAGGSYHQGLCLQVPAYDYAHPDDLLARAQKVSEVPLLLALDGVTDPRNLGAVLRSAAAFGAHGVVVPSRRAAGVTSTAWKVSAGAAARVPVARATNLTRTLQSYRDAGLYVVGLDGEAPLDLADAEVTAEGVVLVVGSEGKGLSRLVRETCDVVAAIPISSSTESLNAGVAAGIALYEISRRRRH
jgi:23S rRNA (guanosine2251-2'-O)-methyltransferase